MPWTSFQGLVGPSRTGRIDSTDLKKASQVRAAGRTVALILTRQQVSGRPVAAEGSSLAGAGPVVRLTIAVRNDRDSAGSSVEPANPLA